MEKTKKNEKIKETAEEVKTETPVEQTAEEKIMKLEGELALYNDKYLRLAAEYDNFRRRSAEERLGVYDSAVTDTLTELLPLFDNLERAESFTDGNQVMEGLSMIAKSVSGVLQKLGVETYGETGETFDPNIHNAVLHIDDEAYGEGEIVEVFQKGYKKGKRIIRFAMVKTAN